jgi:hypothetical protein
MIAMEVLYGVEAGVAHGRTDSVCVGGYRILEKGDESMSRS